MAISENALAIILFSFIVWGFVWTLVGLWKSAKNGHMAWFLVIFFLGFGGGIIPIIYMALFQKKNRYLEALKNHIGKAIDKVYPYDFEIKDDLNLFIKFLKRIKNFVLFVLAVFLSALPFIDSILHTSKKVQKTADSVKFHIFLLILLIIAAIASLAAGGIAVLGGLIKLTILIPILLLFILIGVVSLVKKLWRITR